MVWCRQVANHYLRQCSHKIMSPYSITRPQRVNISTGGDHVSQGLELVFNQCWQQLQIGDHTYSNGLNRHPWVRPIITNFLFGITQCYYYCKNADLQIPKKPTVADIQTSLQYCLNTTLRLMFCSIVDADGLVHIRHQGICNHHDEVLVILM